MGRVKDMYMLMRLSYDQAESDLVDKKTNSVIHIKSTLYLPISLS